jgi:hypothetical protein
MDQATAARATAEVVGWHALPREVEAMVLAHLPPLHALRLATVSSSWHSVRPTRESHISPRYAVATYSHRRLAPTGCEDGPRLARVEVHQRPGACTVVERAPGPSVHLLWHRGTHRLPLPSALVRALTLTPIRAVQVRRAELHGLQLVTNRGVEMLLQWCPHLRALSIRSCPHVTPEARTRPCAHSMRPSV